MRIVNTIHCNYIVTILYVKYSTYCYGTVRYGYGRTTSDFLEHQTQSLYCFCMIVLVYLPDYTVSYLYSILIL